MVIPGIGLFSANNPSKDVFGKETGEKMLQQILLLIPPFRFLLAFKSVVDANMFF